MYIYLVNDNCVQMAKTVSKLFSYILCIRSLYTASLMCAYDVLNEQLCVNCKRKTIGSSHNEACEL